MRTEQAQRPVLMTALAVTIPALVAVALNAPSVTEVLQGDDVVFVVRHRRNGPDFILRAFTELHIGVYYRPVADLWFFAQQKAFDATGEPWHVVTILLHAAAAAALALLALVVTRRLLAAWAAGMLFALTPAYGGGVPWVAHQTEILAGLFATASLGLFVFALRDGFRPVPYAASVVVFGLALGSKEMGATVLAPIVVYTLLQAPDRVWRLRLRGNVRRIAGPFLPLLPFLTAATLWALAQAYVRLVVRPPTLPFYHPGFHAFDTGRYYLVRLVLPVNSGYFGLEALADDTFGTNAPLGYVAAGLVLGLCLYAALRGTAAARVFAAWLLASLVPISFWEPYFTSARYVYVPAAAFAGLVAATGVQAAERLVSRRTVVVGATVAVLLALSVPYTAGTLEQNRRTVDQGKREWRFVEELRALDLDVAPGTTIFLVDTPWNGGLIPAEPMAQLVYGPSVELVPVTAAQLPQVRGEAKGPVLVLTMDGDRLVAAPVPGAVTSD